MLETPGKHKENQVDRTDSPTRLSVVWARVGALKTMETTVHSQLRESDRQGWSSGAGGTEARLTRL